MIEDNDLVNLLRDRTKGSHVGLPSDIEFSISNDILKIHINDPTRNMQTNGAAFEGWAAALKVWLSDVIKFVELDFSVPPDLPVIRLGAPKACHYNRFLYRVNNFSRLFPEWFSLSKNRFGEVSEFMRWLKNEPCLLNHSLRERKSVIDTNKRERKIESWLAFEEGKRLICDLWELDQEKIFIQLPIGVFHKEISSKNAIFTRGAGAIDLWGIGTDRGTLHIFELKCGNNISMGVISEVLFYTAILYDTCVAKEHLFKFGRYRNSPDTKDTVAIQNGGKYFSCLHSHILAERYHPLFSNEVMYLLKEGLSKLGIKFDRVKYDYENKSPLIYT